MKLFNFNRVIRGVFIVVSTIVTLMMVSSSSFSEEPTVTPVFIFIYGYGPLDIGDEVAVYTVDGILCAKTEVAVKGQYGQMAVYGDDLLTQDVVEGAKFGEKLLIKVNGEELYFPAGGSPVFGRDGGTYRVDL